MAIKIASYDVQTPPKSPSEVTSLPEDFNERLVNDVLDGTVIQLD